MVTSAEGSPASALICCSERATYCAQYSSIAFASSVSTYSDFSSTLKSVPAPRA